MASTKIRIAEQVMRLVKGGDQKMASSLHIKEVIELAGQVINQKLKIAHFNETMADGERIPAGHMLATYEEIPVVQYAGRSKSVLPAIPIALPKGVGVYQVIPMKGDPLVPDFSCEYIPVPPGQLWMIQKEGLISDLLDMVGYENYGDELLYSKDLTTMTSPVTKVLVRMAIVDINRLGDTDLLPIPAGMEAEVITDLYQIFTGQRPKPNVVDPVAENSVGGAN